MVKPKLQSALFTWIQKCYFRLASYNCTLVQWWSQENEGDKARFKNLLLQEHQAKQKSSVLSVAKIISVIREIHDYIKFVQQDTLFGLYAIRYLLCAGASRRSAEGGLAYASRSTLVERTLQTKLFYAERTQFPKNRNECNFCCNKTLYQYSLSRRPQKRTQNEPNRTQFQPQPLSKLLLAFTFLRPGYNLAMQNWTIQKLLKWTANYFTEKNMDAPRLSAEMLISHVLDIERIELYTKFSEKVDKPQLEQLRNLVKRAADGEPIQYLIGKTEFYSIPIIVTPDCLIPRPETELLVEKAIEFLRKRPKTQLVCDLCTGSGCIAVAIAKNCENTKITATDISDDALAVAEKNIEQHDLKNRITLLAGDLFDPLIPQIDIEKFDLIVSNPPYVSNIEYDKLDKKIKDHEPKSALYAGTDGLDIYKKIADKAPDFLKSNAALILEIGYNQGKQVKKLLAQTECFSETKIEKDYSDNDRIVTAITKSA